MSYFNKFKSTNIGGGFLNSALGTDPAYAKLEGSLELGKQTETQITDPQTGQTSTVYTNTGGEIIFKNNGATFTLTREILSRLVNVSSDVQNQLDTKASTTYVNGQISLLDNEIETKANVSDLAGYVPIAGHVTINGAKTFSSLVSCSSASQPSLSSHLTTKSYVDGAVNSLQSFLEPLIDSNADDIQVLGQRTTGFTYTSAGDTTTINNNVIVTGNLSVQGLNIKDRLDGLNTSITTGTLNADGVNSDTATIGTLYSEGFSSFFNGNFVVNGGSLFANKSINYQGTAAIFNSNPEGGNTLSAIWRDGASKNTIFDTSWFNNSEGGGFLFRLRNPTTLVNTDVLSLQPTGIDFNAPTTFNSSLPTSTLTPSSNSQLTTKSYVDAADSSLSSSIATKANTSDVVLLSSNQTIAGTKTFSACPKSSLGPSANEDLVRLIFANNNYGRLASANTWSANNTFTGNIIAGGLTITPTELSRLDGITSNIQTQLNSKIGVSTANTFTAKQTFNANIDVANEVVFTSSTAAGAVKGSPSQPLVVTSMAGQDLFLNPDKGATISAVQINQNHAAGRTNVYGHSMNLSCPLNMGTNAINTSANIISSAGVSCNAVTAGSVYGSDTYTNTLRANNFGNVEVTHPLYYNGYFKTRSGVAAYCYDSGYMYPIFCSISQFRPPDIDDRWILMPGYSIVTYEGFGYSGTVYSTPVSDWENDTFDPIVRTSTTANRVASVKVYFRPTSSATHQEVFFTGISN